MPSNITVNPQYALEQLLRALATAQSHEDAATREHAAAKVERWKRVLEGMANETISVGSRTPVANVPAWATLEVVHGGFATGNLLANGPLLPHEHDLVARLALPAEETQRTALNLFHLSDQGREELGKMLASGCFRINVPEEGALLVVAWLLANQHGSQAQELLDAITPFFDRLRFYPVPGARPMLASSVVRLQTVGETIGKLEATRVRTQMQRMHETLRIWTPLYDRAVELFLETVEGPLPSLRTDEKGTLVRRGDGNPMVEGGWPCRHYPDGWQTRVRSLLAEYRRDRTQHAECKKPEKPKENFARLRGYLERCVLDPAQLTGRDVGMIRKILASFVTAHGAPRSAKRHQTRQAQARMAALPTNKELSNVLVQRLKALPADGGLQSLDPVTAPLATEEAAPFPGGAGRPLPASMVEKVARSLEAPVEELVDLGVIPSGEVLARVLPQITSQVRAAGIDNPELRRLYSATYAAFRKRRSLLLLNLEHQVRLEELPWMAAINSFRTPGQDAATSRQTLEQVGMLHLTAFPQTILPNKLLVELRALAAGAHLTLPFTDELAADIFMDEFSGKFLHAAKIAARLLKGTLYERYYGVPFDRVLPMTEKGAGPAPEFAALCRELARVDASTRWTVARNGKMIEQQQILTTHNLAVLVDALGLKDRLRPHLPEMAQRCFQWICKKLQMSVAEWQAKLQRIKNCAYAWRQMMFFLSLLQREEQQAFLSWSHEHLHTQPHGFAERMAPALRGLTRAVGGEGFGPDGTAPDGSQRFLGWTTEKHWLMN